jgi:hypothetical protein
VQLSGEGIVELRVPVQQFAQFGLEEDEQTAEFFYLFVV